MIFPVTVALPYDINITLFSSIESRVTSSSTVSVSSTFSVFGTTVSSGKDDTVSLSDILFSANALIGIAIFVVVDNKVSVSIKLINFFIDDSPFIIKKVHNSYFRAMHRKTYNPDL